MKNKIIIAYKETVEVGVTNKKLEVTNVKDFRRKLNNL